MKSALTFVMVGFVALAGMSASACKGKTTIQTPEAITADYGTKIAKTVKAAQDAVHTVGTVSNSLVVKKGAVKALEGLDKVNDAGLKLADELDRIVALRKAGQPITGDALAQSQTYLDLIDAAIDLDVIPHLGDSEEVLAALKAARAVSKLALEIQLYLGQLKGGA